MMEGTLLSAIIADSNLITGEVKRSCGCIIAPRQRFYFP